MATRIIEFGGDDRNDDLPIYPYNQYLTAQTPITATGTSAQSAAFSTGATMIVVDTDEQVYVHISANPTATTSHLRIPAGGWREFTVKAGDKLAVRT